MLKWVAACTLCLACMLSPTVGTETPAVIAGQWEVTIRAGGETIAQLWTIQQMGAKISGTAKGARGDMPVSGTLAGTRFVVTVKDGGKVYKVLAKLDGDVMDGTMTSDAAEESAWHARLKRRETRR